MWMKFGMDGETRNHWSRYLPYLYTETWTKT